MRRTAFWITSVAAGLLGAGVPGAGAAGAGDAAAACARLAASPYDPKAAAGAGVELDAIDAPKAIEACTQATAASPKDARLRFNLGRAYERAERYDEALAAYMAAGNGGFGLAWNNVGLLYENGTGVEQDDAKAMQFYGKADAAGIPAAAGNLGSHYENAWGVAQDYDRAAALYRKAYKGGDPTGTGNLGWMYENGWGVPQDDAEAVRLYRIAAAAGEDFALNNLGGFYENGRGGLPQDYGEAARYYRLAAAKGLPLANSNLGDLYADGLGVPKDTKEAERFYRLAIAGDDEEVAGTARNALAWMLAINGGSLREAETLSRASLKDDADAGYKRDTLAQILHRQGRNGAALQEQQAAVAAEPEEAAFQAHLGDIYAALGRAPDAKAAWRKALDLITDDTAFDAAFSRQDVERKLGG